MQAEGHNLSTGPATTTFTSHGHLPGQVAMCKQRRGYEPEVSATVQGLRQSSTLRHLETCPDKPVLGQPEGAENPGFSSRSQTSGLKDQNPHHILIT